MSVKPASFKRIFQPILISALTILLLGSGCQAVDTASGHLTAAQIYCQTMGYSFEVRQDIEGNTLEICRFPNGFECPIDDFFYGACGADQTLCALQGNTLERVDRPSGEAAYALCRFPDGSACLAFDYVLYGYKCTLARNVNDCIQIPGGICQNR